jgi:hypothetical protein
LRFFLEIAGCWTVNSKWILTAIDFDVKSNHLDRTSITKVSIPLMGPSVFLMTTESSMCLLLMPSELSRGTLPSFQGIPLWSWETELGEAGVGCVNIPAYFNIKNKLDSA